VFHAGTKLEGAQLVANGGRVLNVTAQGADVTAAQARPMKRLTQSTGRAVFAAAISAGGRSSAKKID
jgi:phosphoribosylamine-glycine ligase